MALLGKEDAAAAFAIAALADCNPFVPQRAVWMQQALGPAYQPFGPVWHAAGDAFLADPNRPHLVERAESLAHAMRRRLAAGATGSEAELATYRGLVFYVLWLHFEDDWYYLMPHTGGPQPKARLAQTYARFAYEVKEFLHTLPGPAADAAHLFALGFQLRRAFDHTFRRIYGGSRPAGVLRAKIWDSIFTQHADLYRRVLYGQMREIPTLVLGESGTGKDLVARAIALSQYIPFDAASGQFVADPAAGYFPVNLAVGPATLVESEMFGHRRGAYTDAHEDRAGCFAMCGAHGAVFLDEIGDLDVGIQLKLLRVLQNREFRRLGDTQPTRFQGKVIAATNRPLKRAIREGAFREDLYYRICADTIATPTLREQLADCPDDLRNLMLILAGRMVGEADAAFVADRVLAFVEAHLGRSYPWPGNIRELEQCVRSVVVRGSYAPDEGDHDPLVDLASRMRAGQITVEEISKHYTAYIYRRTASLSETSRVVGLHRRTIQKYLDGTGDREQEDGAAK